MKRKIKAIELKTATKKSVLSKSPEKITENTYIIEKDRKQRPRK